MSDPLHEIADRRRGDRRRASVGIERRSLGAVEWLGADEAARYLGLPSRKALYQAVRRGQIAAHRLGARRMRFRRVELDRVLERGRQSPVLHSS